MTISNTHSTKRERRGPRRRYKLRPLAGRRMALFFLERYPRLPAVVASCRQYNAFENDFSTAAGGAVRSHHWALRERTLSSRNVRTRPTRFVVEACDTIQDNEAATTSTTTSTLLELCIFDCKCLCIFYYIWFDTVRPVNTQQLVATDWWQIGGLWLVCHRFSSVKIRACPLISDAFVRSFFPLFLSY